MLTSQLNYILMINKSLFTLLTVSALTLTLFSTSISAADLGIKAGDNQGNATFHEILTPGQTINKYVEVINSGVDATSGTVIAKDGLQSADGSYTFISTDEPNKEAGTWYTVPNPNIDLEAGKIVRDSFSITVPDDTKPGEYGSSLAIVEKQNDQVSGNIRVVNRNGLRNLIVVTGKNQSDLKLGNKVENLTFTKSAETNKTSSVGFQLRNVGNLFSKSDITYDLQGPKGYSELQRMTTDLGATPNIVTINSQLQSSSWQNGNYTLTIDLTNSPVNRKLTNSNYIYEVKKQHVVFNFDVTEGTVTGLKTVENQLSKDNATKSSSLSTKNIGLVGLGIISLILLVTLALYLLKNKKIKNDSTHSHPTII